MSVPGPRKNLYRLWSEQEEKVLRKMVEAGCTVYEIQSALPMRSISSIRQKTDFMNMNFRYDNEIDMDAFNSLMGGKIRGWKPLDAV